MNIRSRLARVVSSASILPSASASPLGVAKRRLQRAGERSQRRRVPVNEGYYGERKRLEETVKDLHTTPAGAVVTRNHYGSLVLNASRTLFIDVDAAPPSRITLWTKRFRRREHASWLWMLDDLRTVLASEADEGFRVYRTAAGFRILATTNEHEPDSIQSKQLMDLVGADPVFTDLCRLQNNFRARLSPKPWRCGAQRPPNDFPRASAAEQQHFREWLAHYEYACRDRATCEFLEHVGPPVVHERIRPIVELHDCETKAFQQLPLA